MRIWSIIICAAFICGSAGPALATDWTMAKQSPSGKATHTIYRAPQPLPTVELFNGARTKYIQGFRTDFPAGGTTVCYQYDVMEDASQVLNYYESMFKANQWRVGTVTADQIIARFPKQGYQCSVDISRKAATPGYKTGYRINFGMYKPWGADSQQETASAGTRTTPTPYNRPGGPIILPLQPTNANKPKSTGVQTFH